MKFYCVFFGRRNMRSPSVRKVWIEILCTSLMIEVFLRSPSARKVSLSVMTICLEITISPPPPPPPHHQKNPQKAKSSTSFLFLITISSLIPKIINRRKIPLTIIIKRIPKYAAVSQRLRLPAALRCTSTDLSLSFRCFCQAGKSIENSD